MNSGRRPTAVRATLMALAIATTLSACGRHSPLGVRLPNQKPDVVIAAARLPETGPESYAYRLRWSGSDRDGRVDHYLVALDPKSIDRVDPGWVATEEVERVVTISLGAGKGTLAGRQRAAELHVFAVRAVDAAGETSDAKYVAFTADNMPPQVQITVPHLSNFTPIIPTSFTFEWQGHDPDGPNGLPVQYKYRLFSRHNPDYPEINDFIAFAVSSPDSFRALYSPGYPGWTSVSAETTAASFQNLLPEQTYLFVVSAIDDHGADVPIFSTPTNMVSVVTTNASLGPLLTLYNDSFSYTYPTPGYLDDPARYIRIQQPADRRLTFSWFAQPLPGTSITSYRWVLDPLDLADETPRIDEATDVRHWSARSLLTTSATVGPFSPPVPKVEVHKLYVEATDSYGFRSLGIVHFVIVRPTFRHELLIVDDTRLAPDGRGSNGELAPPVGSWPTAAELDTFLYARGGAPWQGYPPGTLSSPGIFAAYPFDTVGTRGRTISLQTLNEYRHVIWLTDAISATYTSPPNDRVTPITALRSMSSPGQSSLLSTYITLGGTVWLAGGGIAAASLLPWNRTGTPSDVFTNADNELVPGRLMYDMAAWRSEITTPRAAGRLERSPAAVADWPGAPDYSALPLQISRRSAATDPLPPYRTSSQFYPSSFYTETLSKPNEVVEDLDPNPNVTDLQSTLDTLFNAAGVSVQPPRPVMTYYHRPGRRVVFSGTSLWDFQRAHCVALVDFVLQRIWGLTPGSDEVDHPVATRR